MRIYHLLSAELSLCPICQSSELRVASLSGAGHPVSPSVPADWSVLLGGNMAPFLLQLCLAVKASPRLSSSPGNVQHEQGPQLTP